MLTDCFFVCSRARHCIGLLRQDCKQDWLLGGSGSVLVIASTVPQRQHGRGQARAGLDVLMLANSAAGRPLLHGDH